MHSRNITIDTITKIEGNAGLKVFIEDEVVKDLQFIVADWNYPEVADSFTLRYRNLLYCSLLVISRA